LPKPAPVPPPLHEPLVLRISCSYLLIPSKNLHLPSLLSLYLIPYLLRFSGPPITPFPEEGHPVPPLFLSPFPSQFSPAVETPSFPIFFPPFQTPYPNFSCPHHAFMIIYAKNRKGGTHTFCGVLKVWCSLNGPCRSDSLSMLRAPLDDGPLPLVMLESGPPSRNMMWPTSSRRRQLGLPCPSNCQSVRPCRASALSPFQRDAPAKRIPFPPKLSSNPTMRAFRLLFFFFFGGFGWCDTPPKSSPRNNFFLPFTPPYSRMPPFSYMSIPF